jgi:hypothetical protein
MCKVGCTAQAACKCRHMLKSAQHRCCPRKVRAPHISVFFRSHNPKVLVLSQHECKYASVLVITQPRLQLWPHTPYCLFCLLPGTAAASAAAAAANPTHLVLEVQQLLLHLPHPHHVKQLQQRLAALRPPLQNGVATTSTCQLPGRCCCAQCPHRPPQHLPPGAQYLPRLCHYASRKLCGIWVKQEGNCVPCCLGICPLLLEACRQVICRPGCSWCTRAAGR